MDDFFSLPMLFFIVAITAVTWLFRTAVEAVFPSLSAKTPLTTGERIWTKFVLRTIPVILGGAAGLIFKNYPFPEVIKDSLSGRFFYGLSLGFISPWGYRLVMAIANKRWDVTIPDDPRAPYVTEEPNATPPAQPPTPPSGN